MKNLFKIIALASIILSGSLNSSAQVVILKPNRPTVIVKTPVKLRKGYTWVNGHWRWHKGRRVWVKGNWKRNRIIYHRTPGYWKK